MMKRLTLILALLLPLCLFAEQKEKDKEETDTLLLVTKKKLVVNDYTTIGASYGVTVSKMLFNPSYGTGWLVNPNYFSVMWTRYGKMFGYMPYFGLEAGLSYGHQGFVMEYDKEANEYKTFPMGTYENKYWVSKETLRIIKLPVRAKFHVDMSFFRILANLGIYGGYRSSIIREGINVPDQFKNGFETTDNRWDYGLEGGAGFALIFDPVEIQFNVMASWSWNSLYTPDSSPSQYNKYYYRYADPLDIIATVGVHFQLTKRTGKTSHQLKKEAYDIVYGNTESSDSK